MSRSKWLAAAAALAVTFVSTASLALEPEKVPAQKRTKANLYLSAAEVPEFLASKSGHVLFVDVRTPAEVIFVGSTLLMDANIPFKLGPNAALQLEANPAFAAAVEQRLAAKSLAKSDIVVLMCRSGDRSAAAANALTEAGFTQVYSVADGFEGDIAKDGPNAGHRSVNGWKNSGLAWGYAVDKLKMTVALPGH